MGTRLIDGLREIARRSGVITNIRGRGSLVAFTVDTPERRGQIIGDMFDNELIALPCGPNSVRYRLPYVIQAAEIDEILNRTEASLLPPTRREGLTRQEKGG
jgi:L-lysine 6-transaminase